MEQQLLENILEIVPHTMNDLLAQIQAVISTNSVQDTTILDNIIKSLFYGLWNFDKMINQHNLNTKISQLLSKIPRKNSLLFFKALLEYLHQKWNLIDHHRINKFMQLVRYLLVQAFKLGDKHKVTKNKIDKILLQKVYNYSDQRSGLTYHITDIYFQICEQVLPQGATLEELKIFEGILCSHPNQSIRLYIIEHVYGKYKDRLGQKYQGDLEKLQEELLKFSSQFLQLAKKEEREAFRRNLYTLVGFAKSVQFSFSLYIQEKKEKQEREQERKKKKLTKSKRAEIREKKAKKKAKKEKEKGTSKSKKIGKITSMRKFQDKNKMRKGIQLE